MPCARSSRAALRAPRRRRRRGRRGRRRRPAPAPGGPLEGHRSAVRPAMPVPRAIWLGAARSLEGPPDQAGAVEAAVRLGAPGRARGRASRRPRRRAGPPGRPRPAPPPAAAGDMAGSWMVAVARAAPRGSTRTTWRARSSLPTMSARRTGSRRAALQAVAGGGVVVDQAQLAGEDLAAEARGRRRRWPPAVARARPRRSGSSSEGAHEPQVGDDRGRGGGRVGARDRAAAEDADGAVEVGRAWRRGRGRRWPAPARGRSRRAAWPPGGPSVEGPAHAGRRASPAAAARRAARRCGGRRGGAGSGAGRGSCDRRTEAATAPRPAPARPEGGQRDDGGQEEASRHPACFGHPATILHPSGRRPAILCAHLLRICNASRRATMADDTREREADWREKLTPEQYAVAREGATERPFTRRLLGQPRRRRLPLRLLRRAALRLGRPSSTRAPAGPASPRPRPTRAWRTAPTRATGWCAPRCVCRELRRAPGARLPRRPRRRPACATASTRPRSTSRAATRLILSACSAALLALLAGGRRRRRAGAGGADRGRPHAGRSSRGSGWCSASRAPTPPAELERRIRRGEAGAVMLLGANMPTPAAARALTARLQAIPRPAAARRAAAGDDRPGGRPGAAPAGPPGPARARDRRRPGRRAARAAGRAAGGFLRGRGRERRPGAGRRRGPARLVPRGPGRRLRPLAGAVSRADGRVRGRAAEAGVLPRPPSTSPGSAPRTVSTDAAPVRIDRPGAPSCERVDLRPYRALIAHRLPMVMLGTAIYPRPRPGAARGALARRRHRRAARRARLHGRDRHRRARHPRARGGRRHRRGGRAGRGRRAATCCCTPGPRRRRHGRGGARRATALRRAAARRGRGGRRAGSSRCARGLR